MQQNIPGCFKKKIIFDNMLAQSAYRKYALCFAIFLVGYLSNHKLFFLINCIKYYSQKQSEKEWIVAHEYKLSLYNYNIYKSRKYDTPRLENILKNCISPQQHHCEKYHQKAQTEEMVNHAEGNITLFCARKQNSSLESSHNTADCNFPL